MLPEKPTHLQTTTRLALWNELSRHSGTAYFIAYDRESTAVLVRSNLILDLVNDSSPPQ
jgi:hypothetical protein